MLRFVVVAFGLIMSLASFSSYAFSGPGWVTSVMVKKVVVTYNGGINVRVEPELTGCTSQSGYGGAYASVYPSHPGIDRIHSILMTAYAMEKPVALWFGDSNCMIGEVELGGR